MADAVPLAVRNQSEPSWRPARPQTCCWCETHQVWRTQGGLSSAPCRRHSPCRSGGRQADSPSPRVPGTSCARHVPVPRHPLPQESRRLQHHALGTAGLGTSQLWLLQSHCRWWRWWSLAPGNLKLNLSSSFLVPSSSRPANSWFAAVSPVFLHFSCLALLLLFF